MPRFFYLCLLYCALALASGCASRPNPMASAVKDAAPETVQNCQYLADVEGSSGWGNLAASTGIANAKNEARSNAASLGATHIVWKNVSGGYSPFVSGAAYRCGK